MEATFRGAPSASFAKHGKALACCERYSASTIWGRDLPCQFYSLNSVRWIVFNPNQSKLFGRLTVRWGTHTCDHSPQTIRSGDSLAEENLVLVTLINQLSSSIGTSRYRPPIERQLMTQYRSVIYLDLFRTLKKLSCLNFLWLLPSLTKRALLAETKRVLLRECVLSTPAALPKAASACSLLDCICNTHGA